MADFWIFDRERSVHPWREALRELAEGADPSRRSIGINWCMDHRISEARELGDLACAAYSAPVPMDARSWWKARERYFREEICTQAPKVPAYLRPTNLPNVAVRTPSFDRLVHVGCLDSLLARALRSAGAADVELALKGILGRSMSSRAAGTSGVSWPSVRIEDFAIDLRSRGEDAIRQVAGLLTDALGDSPPPWWACFAEEIQPQLDSGEAAAICSALGLGHRRSGEWLLIWEYPVDAAMPLYRPTVAEADDSPYHFPSPPGYWVGITMALDPAIPSCREVIHHPLRGAAAIEHCTGRLLQVAPGTLGDVSGLAALRATHRKRLEQEFNSAALTAWLDRHPEVP